MGNAEKIRKHYLKFEWVVDGEIVASEELTVKTPPSGSVHATAFHIIESIRHFKNEEWKNEVSKSIL
ncbi:hypothetical protein [Neisseria wadsworthii]|uniref:Uncharacterized protein n=1 Tax=Neisseria wadsworthii 9715 TaxID=1030841 RepID=G4CPH6_9NEIS|nr:hypothetical protein [Neisseria wadsworthii]EGZ47895.1 hypothetical protein HMPREF9370_0976 [Neisseria wadsworthii 9715]QMT34783.1 hypothetical protein H3L96_06745 [Neisseria wadsworthii]